MSKEWFIAEVLDAILSRRSIRKYMDETVSDEEEVWLLKAVSHTLSLPPHIIPLCVIGVGHPAEQKDNLSEERYEKSKIHHER